jgi:drug/metabolite transporter (DMT)-like permease
MKKTVIILSAIISPYFAQAQEGSALHAPEVFRVVAMIFTVGLFMWFILAIMKRIMDNKLKNKIVDKGVPDSVVASVLKTNPKEDLNANIKWFAILAGLGIALTAIHYTLPLGIHSLAIMAFSIALSFLGYFVFLKISDKNNS